MDVRRIQAWYRHARVACSEVPRRAAAEGVCDRLGDRVRFFSRLRHPRWVCQSTMPIGAAFAGVVVKGRSSREPRTWM